MLLSEYLWVEHEKFQLLGVFDPILERDTPLFISFSLLENSTIEEFRSSYSILKDRIAKIIRLLSLSDERNDKYWKAAVKLIVAPEAKSLCIGYSQGSTRGGWIWKKIANDIAQSLHSFIDKGVSDPEIIKLVWAFWENIWPDRISDFIGNVVSEDLKSYTVNVVHELGIWSLEHDERFENWIPVNPISSKPILLVPKSLLKDLPVFVDWDSIEDMFYKSLAEKDGINSLVANEVAKLSSNERKRRILGFLSSSGEGIRKLLNNLSLSKEKDSEPYPLDFDPKWLYIWHEIAETLTSTNPLLLSKESGSTGDYINIVRKICNEFKELVENNGLRKIASERMRLPERFWQLLFFAIARSYCEANHLDISPESNTGRWPVDFKISRGEKKILVEVKLSDNSHILQWYEKQIEEYKKSENAQAVFYLIIKNWEKWESNIPKIQNLSKNDGRKVEVIVADATELKSASKV